MVLAIRGLTLGGRRLLSDAPAQGARYHCPPRAANAPCLSSAAVPMAAELVVGVDSPGIVDVTALAASLDGVHKGLSTGVPGLRRGEALTTTPYRMVRGLLQCGADGVHPGVSIAGDAQQVSELLQLW